MRQRFPFGRSALCLLFAAILFGGFLFSLPPVHATELYTTSLYSDANLTSYYRFEGNSTDATSSNNGSDTAISYSSSSGKYGEYASFNGSNSSIITATSSGMSGSAARSMSLWFYCTTTTADLALAGYGNYQVGGGGWTLFANRSEGGTGSLGLNIAGPGSIYTSSGIFSNNVWNHVVITYSGGNLSTGVIIYLNGATTTLSVSNDTTPSTQNTPYYIGVGHASTNFSYYNGYIDDVAFFNRVLTTSEVSELYSSSPYLGSSLHQYKSDASTTIAAGAATTENTVVFGANLASGGTSTLQLQVEVTSTGNSFSNIAMVTSSFVSIGSNATASFTGANGNYHWQARVVDTGSGSSTWQTFGTNATSTIDFNINYTASSSVGELYTTILFNDPNLNAYYRMEGSSNDSKGSNNGSDSSISYNASYGKYGQGASFLSASNSHIITGSNSGISGSAPRTISVWFYCTATTADLALAGYGYYQTGGAGWTLFANRSEGGTGSLGLNVAGAGSVYTASGIFSNNTWNHAVITYSGGTLSSGVKIYLNGVSQSLTVSNDTTPNTQNTPYYIGEGHASPDFGYFNGYLDDVAFFNRALTATEVSELYNATLPTVDLATSSLGQYMSDATTTIGEGSTTMQSTVVFGANVNGAGTSTVQLQVEVKPIGVSFDGTPNVTSTFISPGGNATATYTASSGSYHWQARVLNYAGVTSTWQLFGSSSTSTDFIINIPMSVNFNGSSTWIYPATNLGFTATDPFTIEFWYRTVVPTSTNVDFVDMGTASSGFSIRRELDNGIQFDMQCATGTIDFLAAPYISGQDGAAQNGGSDNPSGIWHGVVITKGTGTTLGTFNLYFDGVAQTLFDASSTSISGNCFNSTSTDSIWFGGTPSNDPLTGQMDEVRIWDIEKSNSDVSSTWNTELSATSSNLIGLWQFNGTSSDSITRNGPTLIGSPSFATSSPFGHFLLDQTNIVTKTAAQNDQILWYASGSQYSSEVDGASAIWNTLGGLTITSTTLSSNANLVLDDVYGRGDLPWDAEWTNATSGISQIQFNVSSTIFITTDLLQRLSAHELGHALGLAHSYAGNLMNWLVPESGAYFGPQDIIDYDYLKGQGIWGN
jgi:hypothetical protein